MAKLSQFKIDSGAVKEGRWIRVGEEFEDLEIQCRGLTDAYFDAQANRQRRAAQSLGGDVQRLPTAIRRAINLACLIDHVLLDPPARNLFHDDGREVSGPEFLELLRNPDFPELFLAVFRAATQVGQRVATDIEDARGNSDAA